jgi:ABC-2 type transport system permease protein
MRPIFVIAWKDLKQRLRDRSAIVAAFIAPLVLAFIVSGAFGSGFTGAFEANYLVLDQDGSDLSRAFSEQVLKAPQFKDQITSGDARSLEEARKFLAEDRISGAFVIPEGFARAVLGNRKTSIQVLRNAEAQIAGIVAEALANAYTGQINAARLAVFTTVGATQQRTGQAPSPERIAAIARAAATDRLPVQLVDGAIGVRKVTGANYFGPAMAIFSLFFTTAFVARSLIAEREEGTLPRVLASPIPRPSLVLGKSASSFVLGLSSFAVMFGVFGLLLDVQWGDPLALIVLTVAIVLAVMGLMTVVQTLAKTQQGADAVTQVTTISLALFGGSFFPLFQMPALMQKISYLTPNGWALRGFTDIAYDGAKLGDITTNLLAISAFAIVTIVIGAVRSRRLT